ncbi:isocitrate lyase/phosphoenolpyruvate mutase family protein [Belliella marina]|uniref:Isocitrate lyase/phosphoenolpyruvate mutase family protein n=1 Tax=Belliella marina TaxID=1644146 RepID=A0ABW4VID7_9BACT
MKFKDLHNQDKPLLMANVWDVPSAKIAEKLNIQAIGTSSSAIASQLGYEDGEKLDFLELAAIVARILRHTDLPLSVDLEAGYSRNPGRIADNIKRLVDIGVVGINIEDSIVETERALLTAESFAESLSTVNEILQKDHIDIFINVRTDTFLLGQANATEETIRRIRLYENAGANGIFTPCIENESDITDIVSCTNLPINVMCMPLLPDFETLFTLGVKRISMGNFLYNKMYTQFEKLTATVLSQKSFEPVF